MAIKKSQLYSSLWDSCDKLRGGMDASQYKDYILTILFVKYISDKYEGVDDGQMAVPKDGSFSAMVAAKGSKDIGDRINKIIGNLAEANDLKGVIDTTDFNDDTKLGRGKDMQDRLTKLIGIFESLDFQANRAEGDDLLGDAYEYLMRHFATESGKSKGQFYTPSEVSMTLAKLLDISSDTSPNKTVYDPTCGSGSLLLKASSEGSENGLSIYGQENDNATWSLCRMNMILHGSADAEIAKGNTIAEPIWKNPDGGIRQFDFCVANPPFSLENWATGIDPNNDEYRRFEYGSLPEKNGDYAFLLHILKSLKSNGQAAVILPLGVLFRGGREETIRKKLLEQGFIQGIISLPPNLFYGTGIPACIIFLNKKDSDQRKELVMIDASKEFIKDGNKNRLRSQDIRKIVDTFKGNLETEYYSRLVPFKEIEDNNYDLSVSRYIESGEIEDIQDLNAHMNGGIPNRDVDLLDNYWQAFPSLKTSLLDSIQGRPSYSALKVDNTQVIEVIVENQEFKEFKNTVSKLVHQWFEDNKKELYDFSKDSLPKELIKQLSFSVLDVFQETELLDKYSAYQIFMNYLSQTLQDDLYLIGAEGWSQAAQPRTVIEDKDKKIKEDPDLIVGVGKKTSKYKTDLIPPTLIEKAFFEAEMKQMETKEGELIRADEKLASFIESKDFSEEIKNDKEEITKTLVTKRIKSLDTEADKDELALLKDLLNLIEAKDKSAKELKALRSDIDEKVYKYYSKLDEKQIKDLVINNKWISSFKKKMLDKTDSLVDGLVARIELLNDRYGESLPTLDKEVSELEKTLLKNLESIGVSNND